ncbi:MAG: hypothetical protein ACETVZ_03155 [Phycisphaerae bacterium]
MKMTGTINIMILCLVLVFSCYFNAYAQTSPAKVLTSAETGPNQSAAETVQRTYETAAGTITLRPRMSIIKTVDFHLRSGELVYGKQVSEDKNMITVEKLDESRVVVSTYSKREIEPRTLQTKTVPEYKYYLDLAEYFSARTWDFRDDPDDFIQAIRCCEKAKQLVLETPTPDSEKIQQINEKIQKLQADRQVWETEVRSRAELKKLEFEAEIENRLKELENKVNVDSQQIGKSLEQFDEFLTEMKDNYQRLEQNISAITQDLSRRLNVLADRVEANTRLIDPFRWGLYPRYYYNYRPYYYRPGDQR